MHKNIWGQRPEKRQCIKIPFIRPPPTEKGPNMFRQLDIWDVGGYHPGSCFTQSLMTALLCGPIKAATASLRARCAWGCFLPSRRWFCDSLWTGKMFAAVTLFVFMCLTASSHAEHHHPCRKNSYFHLFGFHLFLILCRPCIWQFIINLT